MKLKFIFATAKAAISLMLAVMISISAVSPVFALTEDITPSKKEELLTAFIEYSNEKHPGNHTDISQVTLYDYFGVYNGYDIFIAMDISDAAGICDVPAFREIGGHTFKFDSTTFAYKLYAHFDGAIFEISNAFEIGTFTSDDIKAIGSLTGFLTDEKPTGLVLGELSEALEEELCESFSYYPGGSWWSDDNYVYDYYCRYNGYEIVIMQVKGYMFPCAIETVYIAGYSFTFPYLGLSPSFLAYRDGEFFRVDRAYEAGIFSKEDIYNIASSGGSKPNTLTDIEGWSERDIKLVNRLGLMYGTSDTTFEPKSDLTRAMVATILHRMAGEPAPKSHAPFTDLSEGQTWYHDAVAWGYEKGIIDGIGNNRFAPDDMITREQLITLLYRYSRYFGYDISADSDLSSFPDNGSISEFAMEACKWGCGNGLINGSSGYEYDDPDNLYLNPKKSATREQFAAVVARYLTRFNLINLER